MTLPKASSTACDVKFSEGIRLMKCFCRLVSYMSRISEDSLILIMECSRDSEYSVPFEVSHTQQDLLLPDLQPIASKSLEVSSYKQCPQRCTLC